MIWDLSWLGGLILGAIPCMEDIMQRLISLNPELWNLLNPKP